MERLRNLSNQLCSIKELESLLNGKQFITRDFLKPCGKAISCGKQVCIMDKKRQESSKKAEKIHCEKEGDSIL